MTDESVRISLCIVSWNVRDDLLACLNSLPDASQDCPIETIVVDNASSDDTVDLLRERFPEVVLIANRENRGFAGGTNQALAAARGDYLMLLNPDTVLPPGALSDLLTFAEAHPEAGIVAPKLVNPDGSLQHSCRRFPRIAAALFRHTILGRLFPNNPWASEYIMGDWAHDSVREVDWVSGACFMVRRALYKEIGALDEGFFWGSEDVDYCYRAHAAGSAVLYTPSPAIMHRIGSSSSQMPVRTIINFHRSMHRLYRKHLARNVFEYGLASVGIVTRAVLLIVSWWARFAYGVLSRPFRKAKEQA
ncbi:MAG TPA: glycosyltransferase family 2 protein [Armatimonadota bacterium]|nr:glycosyltransferase family 2 protein [Armatimonadota bacterium]